MKCFHELMNVEATHLLLNAGFVYNSCSFTISSVVFNFFFLKKFRKHSTDSFLLYFNIVMKRTRKSVKLSKAKNIYGNL